MFTLCLNVLYEPLKYKKQTLPYVHLCAPAASISVEYMAHTAQTFIKWTEIIGLIWHE